MGMRMQLNSYHFAVPLMFFASLTSLESCACKDRSHVPSDRWLHRAKASTTWDSSWLSTRRGLVEIQVDALLRQQRQKNENYWRYWNKWRRLKMWWVSLAPRVRCHTIFDTLVVKPKRCDLDWHHCLKGMWTKFPSFQTLPSNSYCFWHGVECDADWRYR